MNTFAFTALLVLYIFQFGSANETLDKARKDVESLKEQAKTHVSILLTATEEYMVELNEHIDAQQARFKTSFDEEIKSSLTNIKNYASKQKKQAGSCYDAAKSRFDKLDVSANYNVEQCAVNKEGGVDADEAFDSLLILLTTGKKYIGHVEKLEKEIQKASEGNLSTLVKNKLPAAAASLQIYEVSVNSATSLATKADKETERWAMKCADKELVDVHTIALSVTEIAYDCINNA